MMAFAYLSGKVFESSATGKGKLIKGMTVKGQNTDLEAFKDLVVGKKPKTAQAPERDYVLKMQHAIKQKMEEMSSSSPKYDNNDLMSALSQLR